MLGTTSLFIAGVFYRRIAKGIDGTFITRDAIERRNPGQLTSILNNVNSVRVDRRVGKAGNNSVVLGRGGICALGLGVDDQRLETAGQRRARGITETIDDIVPVSMTAGIEVYPSAASVPKEFQNHVDGCGLIVVWTKYR